MRDVKEIEIAIASLPAEDYKKFRRWFFERDWERWDKQMEEDSKTGALDFLVKEALNAKKEKRLKGL